MKISQTAWHNIPYWHWIFKQKYRKCDVICILKNLRENLKPFGPALCDWGTQREDIWQRGPWWVLSLCLPAHQLFVFHHNFFCRSFFFLCWTMYDLNNGFLWRLQPKPPISHALASHVSISFSLCMSSKRTGLKVAAAVRKRHCMRVHTILRKHFVSQAKLVTSWVITKIFPFTKWIHPSYFRYLFIPGSKKKK